MNCFAEAMERPVGSHEEKNIISRNVKGNERKRRIESGNAGYILPIWNINLRPFKSKYL